METLNERKSEWFIITDGAYRNSIDVGGIGIVFVKDNRVVKTYSKRFEKTTNNRMELTAVIYALAALKDTDTQMTLCTDSMYVFGTLTKGWKKKTNLDLWRVLDKYLTPRVSFKWVKGHSKESDNFSKWNNLADQLATDETL